MASVDRVRIQKPSRSQVQLYNLACAVPELSVYSAEASEILFSVGFAEQMPRTSGWVLLLQYKQPLAVPVSGRQLSARAQGYCRCPSRVELIDRG